MAIPNKSFDWQKSKPHNLFLSKFVDYRELKEFTKYQDWENVLKEKPEKALERFVTLGLIEVADLQGHLMYYYKIPELKELLKGKGLLVSGKKEVLVNRLIDFDENWITKLVYDRKIFHCTKRGAEVANKFISWQEEQRKHSEELVYESLKKHEFKEACKVVANYEANQVFKRGLGIDWANYNDTDNVAFLNAIFSGKPKILARLPDNEAYFFRIEAGAKRLWGNPNLSFIPEDFITSNPHGNDYVVRAFMSYGHYCKEISSYRKMGYKKAKLFTCNDSYVCPACIELSKKKLKLNDFPELPYEKCTCKDGCRCWIGVADFN